jgi:glycine/D-amino acid oxidase-like deaminating enzyme
MTSHGAALRGEADVVVIGGGLSGASIAYHLALRGQHVVLVERGELASGASSASTGWATVHFASYMTEYPDSHMRLMAKGLDLFVELGEQLGEEVEYEQTGGLSLIYDEDELASSELLAQRLTSAGIPAQILGREAVLALEPHLGGRFIGGLYSSNEALITPPLLIRALASRASDAGAELLTQTEATAIEVEDGAVTAVDTTAGRIRTPVVVNAAGLDGVRVAALVGLDLPMYPSRGQQLVVSAPPGLLRRAVHNPGLARPTREGYIVGGMREQDTDASEITLSGARQLAEHAAALVPALRDAPVVGLLPGIRPVPRDGMPIYGAVAGLHGFFLANLHFGLTLFALTGRVLTSLVLGEEPELDVGEYRYDRFANPATPAATPR